MISLSEHEHPNPDDPTPYAPRWLRERSQSRLSPSHATVPEPVRSPISSPVSLDNQLENAVSDALWHPLDPEFIHEPPGFAQEDRRATLIAIASRFAAALGVSAIAASFFVIMVPGSSAPGIMRSIKAVLLQGSKPAIAEFEPILASAQTRPATHEQSEQLLQQFLQWRRKPNSSETSQ